MNNDRITIKLGDVGKVSMCKRVLKHQTFKDAVIPFYKISTFGSKPDTYIKKELFEKYREKYSYPKKGDVLISAAGTVGKTVVYNGEPAYFQDSNIVWIDNDESKILNSYLYYFYQTKPWLSTSSSTIKRIYNENLRSIKIIYPEKIEYQKMISKILLNFDAKIELNNKLSSELEKIAKTIYGYWFLQFNFPDDNGKPYKSSGGKMVWNRELKRKIPKDWEVKKMKDIFEFKKGVEPGSSEYLNSPINEYCIKFFRVGDIEGESSVYIDSRSKKYSFVHEKDVIVTFDGSVGKVGVGLNGAISGGLRKVYDKSGKFDNSLVYIIFKDERIIATIHKYATGSILLHAGGSIDHLKIVFNEEMYLQFQKIIQPIYNQIIKNKKENQKLAELRDFLLPMLMNGQVVIR